jgi:hypothetical protein
MESSASTASRFLVSGPPLALAILELWHPIGDGQQSAFASIMPKVNWWLLLHLLQLPLFALLGLSVILLGWHQQGTAIRISRVAILFFWVFYTALDSITGIAGGLLIRSARYWPSHLQALVAQQINIFFFDPLLGGSTLSLLGALGAGGWLLGVVFLAYALSRDGLDRFTVALFFAAAILFALSHTPPTGPFGLFLYFLATLRLPLSGGAAQLQSARP